MRSFVGDGGTRSALQTSVVEDDASLLSAGDRVEYEWREGGTGLEAIDVLRAA